MSDEMLGMRGNFFAEPGHFQVDAETGVIETRTGRRVVCLDHDFLSGFRESFEIECGEAADLVMETCGWEYGQLFARQLDGDLSDYYGRSSRRLAVAFFDAVLQQAFAHYGWGVLSLDLGHHQRGVVVARVDNPIFASVVEKASKPCDTLLAGFLAGLLSYYAEEKLAAVQTECVAAGAEASRFVITSAERLDEVRDDLEGLTHEAALERILEAEAALA